MNLVYEFVYRPSTDWTFFVVSLNESAGWEVEGEGRAPTQGEMQAVLGALSGLRIRGEYRSGPDTGGLDNVFLNPSGCADRGADVYWIEPTGGDWTQSAKWSSGMTPRPSQDAFVTLEGAYSGEHDVNIRHRL